MSKLTPAIQQIFNTDAAQFAQATATARIVGVDGITEKLIQHSARVRQGQAALHLKAVFLRIEQALYQPKIMSITPGTATFVTTHRNLDVNSDLMTYVLGATGEAYWQAGLSHDLLQPQDAVAFMKQLHAAGNALQLNLRELPDDVANLREWVLRKLANFTLTHKAGGILRDFVNNTWTQLDNARRAEIMDFVKQHVTPALARML
ncbi:MAG TPA: hypothetical protein VD907_01795 [Verrucomicrobiae bacterium]|nr:hypothetical protein [Verrucomicrobiae bacterium]